MDYHSKGFVDRFPSTETAEKAFGSLVVSPLGVVSKQHFEAWKHRIIHDLRRGGPNRVASSWERIVLPRPADHGWDLHDLRAAGCRRYGPDEPWDTYTLVCPIVPISHCRGRGAYTLCSPRPSVLPSIIKHHPVICLFVLLWFVRFVEAGWLRHVGLVETSGPVGA